MGVEFVQQSPEGAGKEHLLSVGIFCAPTVMGASPTGLLLGQNDHPQVWPLTGLLRAASRSPVTMRGRMCVSLGLPEPTDHSIYGVAK